MAGTSKPQPAGALVVEACRQFPKASNNALAKRLHNAHPAKFPTFNSAQCAVRYYRGARGPESRKAVAINRTERLPPLPESRATEWKPFPIECKRCLVLSDIHIPYQDNAAIEAALGHGDEFKPDAILINGDLFDFYQISRFDKDPTMPKVAAELLAGGQFLDHLRKRFPKSRIVFKKGNHDERWDAYLFKVAPALADVPGIRDCWQDAGGIKRNRVEVVGDQRPVMLGKLMVLHGHEKGRGISSPVNQARGAFLRLLCSVLEGHGHRTSEHTERTADGQVISCRSTGALCGLWPDFAKCNKWDHGFATIEVEKDGNYVCSLKRIIEGKVY